MFIYSAAGVALWMALTVLYLIQSEFSRGLKVSFRRTVSRVLSSLLAEAERIIYLSSLTRDSDPPFYGRYRGADRSRASYLALHPAGFSVPRRFLARAVVSYTTFSPLPYCCQPGGMFSVALSVSTP